MNKETFEGAWNQLKGKAKEKWGKLTDEDLTKIDGKKDQLIGKLQEKYGYLKDKAEEEISSWEKSCGSCGCDHEHSNERHAQTNQKNKH